MDENQPESGAAILRSEDFWAITIAAVWLAVALLCVLLTQPSETSPEAQIVSPLKGWITKPAGWQEDPSEAFFPEEKPSVLPGIAAVFCLCLVLFVGAAQGLDGRGADFLFAFPVVFMLAALAHLLAGQAIVKYYSLSYALWALAAGLLIANTVGTPRFLQPAVRTELYIKTGLVILGAEVLLSKLLALGVPGIFVAWVVTPTVLVTTFWFGQRILRIASPTLNMVISADMSVCGVSAAIATAAACRAKKEELSAAIGLSLMFTVVMMVVLPTIIQATGMDPILGGAWIGGTIDSTGAVAAAGAFLGDGALKVATTVKMIQNVLIGVVAFGVAVYWMRYQTAPEENVRPSAMEIWRRFPKFVLGFLAASLVFSAVFSLVENGPQIVSTVIADSTKTMRSWLFALAFVSIGLESNFRTIARQFRGGKPLLLYVIGQSFNLCLTLLMCWLMFRVIFPEASHGLAN